jgi:hypothetical protein
MAISTTCPHCGKTSNLPAELRGKKVRCKSCEETFVVKSRSAPVADSDDEESAGERSRTSPRPARKAVPVRRDDDEDDRPRRRNEEEERPRRQGKKKAAQQSSSLLPLLLVGGGAAFLVVAVAVVGAVWAFSGEPPAPAPAPVAVVQDPQPAPAAPAPKEEAKPAPQPAPPPVAPPPDNGPQPQPQPVNPVRPAEPAPRDVPAVPAAAAGLRYRFDGAPHVYRVRVEVDLSDAVEVHEGACIVTVAPGNRKAATGETVKVTFASGLFKQDPKAAPGPFQFRGTTSACSVTMDRFGHILEAGGSGNQLPALLGELGQFLIDPLPQDDRASWEFNSTSTVGEAGATGPLGFRPHMSGNRPIGWTPTTKNVREAKESTTFQRGEAVNNIVTLRKQYEMKVPAAGTSPAMTLSARGDIRFDTQAGMPRDIDYKGTLALEKTNLSAKIPLKVTYTLLEGEEKERIVHPPPPPKVEPKAYSDAEMVELLADLRGTDDNKRWAAVDKLSKAKVTTRREEVARALNPLLERPNNPHRGSCVAAVTVWGTSENVPVLLPMLGDKDGWARVAVIKALGEIGDERAIEPLAKWLTNWFGRAETSQALQKMGSKAETVVLGYLEHTDAAVRTEACKILAVIGTKRSKPALDKASTDRNPGVAAEAKRAAAAVAARP